MIGRKWQKLQKKIRFIREQGRLFQSERAKYADTFLSIDKTFLYTSDQKYLLGLFRLFWLCNSD